MNAAWLKDRLLAFGDRIAVIWRDEQITYGQLLESANEWRTRLLDAGVGPNTAVAVEGDYSPGACALLLALIDLSAIAVPLTASTETQRRGFFDSSRARHFVRLDHADRAEWNRRDAMPHELFGVLAARQAPGLILFTSGSTGEHRAVLHDLSRLLEKFATPRPPYRTLAFLYFNHVGGVNTLFHTLANGGTLVAIPSRDPDTVCAAIARHRVQLLPTSPTFLNLLLISDSWRDHDLSSLEIITYGTEVMPAATLVRLRDALPHVRLHQTYGLSEVGILRSKSRDDGSTWMRVGGEGYETRVVDGLLQIRAHSAMLGYLNAESPFDPDGWLNTRDVVEVDGEFLRILGRQSDVINVGGEKVYPAQVESVLLEAPNVVEAVVRGEPNPLFGQIVAATLHLAAPEEPEQLRRRIRAFCAERLPRYQVPVRIRIAEDEPKGPRVKKLRR